jgi:hypothetical protein
MNRRITIAAELCDTGSTIILGECVSVPAGGGGSRVVRGETRRAPAVLKPACVCVRMCVVLSLPVCVMYYVVLCCGVVCRVPEVFG